MYELSPPKYKKHRKLCEKVSSYTGVTRVSLELTLQLHNKIGTKI